MVSSWIRKGTVVGRPDGPTETSEFEHSSIPTTIKKIFNLSSDFLTKRDAWAGTFEHIFTELDEPRTDYPETLPEVPFERPTLPKEHGWLSDFQRELVELASFLNGLVQLLTLQTSPLSSGYQTSILLSMSCEDISLVSMTPVVVSHVELLIPREIR
ncbi:unnamed protein product [Urochloa humidicola]